MIALPNGEWRLIRAEWTDQAPRINYPLGACFIAERLLHVRQRLDELCRADAELALMLYIYHKEVERAGSLRITLSRPGIAGRSTTAPAAILALRRGEVVYLPESMAGEF